MEEKEAAEMVEPWRLTLWCRPGVVRALPPAELPAWEARAAAGAMSRKPSSVIPGGGTPAQPSSGVAASLVGGDGLLYTLFSAPSPLPMVHHRAALELCESLSPERQSRLASYDATGTGAEERGAVERLCGGCGCWVNDDTVDGQCPVLGEQGIVQYGSCFVPPYSYVCQQGTAGTFGVVGIDHLQWLEPPPSSQYWGEGLPPAAVAEAAACDPTLSPYSLELSGSMQGRFPGLERFVRNHTILLEDLHAGSYWRVLRDYEKQVRHHWAAAPGRLPEHRLVVTEQLAEARRRTAAEVADATMAAAGAAAAGAGSMAALAAVAAATAAAAAAAAGLDHPQGAFMRVDDRFDGGERLFPMRSQTKALVALLVMALQVCGFQW
ncbi:hypothetical protein TSOC_000705 [Tetrabaena socialis]|uniref:Uncharacterized protein n=1 Tax=Tetrabaena socialis TaxID=47790 RepID=A0A2J8AIQ2_9CHLO|nr:hypothetical protein TSOC_000705 [Tetrabaena socialis]|eukprot:PNH12399.1 hypothetical protein TSOC_000705 [Tetrabaena socialis]